MKDIRIRRFTDHPHGYQGAIEPTDGRWQLCIDEDGNPHLFVRVWVEQPDGSKIPGLMNTDVLSEARPCDVIDSIAEHVDLLPPEQEAEALAELGDTPICPA